MKGQGVAADEPVVKTSDKIGDNRHAPMDRYLRAHNGPINVATTSRMRVRQASWLAIETETLRQIDGFVFMGLAACGPQYRDAAPAGAYTTSVCDVK